MPNSGSPQNNETEVAEAEGGGIDKNGFGAEEVAGEDINESFGWFGTSIFINKNHITILQKKVVT